MPERGDSNPGQAEYSREGFEWVQRRIESIRSSIKDYERDLGRYTIEEKEHTRVFNWTQSPSSLKKLGQAHREVERRENEINQFKQQLEDQHVRLEELLAIAQDQAIEENQQRELKKMLLKFDRVLELEPKIGPLVDSQYQTPEEKQYYENLHVFLDDLDQYFKHLDKKEKK